MPQLDFIFSAKEIDELVRLLFNLGAWLVPSHLRSSRISRMRNFREYQSKRDGEKLFHIQHRNFESAPLEVRHARSNDEADIYYIMQRNGGPTIDLLGPYEFQEDGITRVGPCWIGYYPTFWNTLTQANEAAPTAQQGLYAELTRHVKTNSVRVRSGKRTYWVGRSTSVALANRAIALPTY